MRTQEKTGKRRPKGEGAKGAVAQEMGRVRTQRQRRGQEAGEGGAEAIGGMALGSPTGGVGTRHIRHPHKKDSGAGGLMTKDQRRLRPEETRCNWPFGHRIKNRGMGFHI